jgi:UDP-N-acetylmuramoyl-tripeptide--D-alanyl-D-alanine ligase
VRLALPGRHNAVNALAAAAATWAAGWSLDEIVAGLARVSGVKGRMSLRKARSGALIIDDAYNANPTALQAAIDYATALPGETWLVLGDMRELGEASPELHAAAGRYAREHGVARLYALGPESAAAVAAFGAGAALRRCRRAGGGARGRAARRRQPAGQGLALDALETVVERLVEEEAR